MAKKNTAAAKITAVKKGEVYENKHKDLIEIVNGRLKDEGDLGMSFEGKSVIFDSATKTAKRDKKTERFYLDELVCKLTKAEVDEWVATGKREAEAAEAANEPPTKTKKATTKATAKPKAAKATKPAKATDGKMSALDAAAKVLGESKEPMTTGAMIEAMAAKKYWVSPGGKTPAATLYSAILREINVKGKVSRFKKTDRGLFATK